MCGYTARPLVEREADYRGTGAECPAFARAVSQAGFTFTQLAEHLATHGEALAAELFATVQSLPAHRGRRTAVRGGPFVCIEWDEAWEEMWAATAAEGAEAGWWVGWSVAAAWADQLVRARRLANEYALIGWHLDNKCLRCGGTHLATACQAAALASPPPQATPRRSARQPTASPRTTAPQLATHAAPARRRAPPPLPLPPPPPPRARVAPASTRASPGSGIPRCKGRGACNYGSPAQEAPCLVCKQRKRKRKSKAMQIAAQVAVRGRSLTAAEVRLVHHRPSRSETPSRSPAERARESGLESRKAYELDRKRMRGAA